MDEKVVTESNSEAPYRVACLNCQRDMPPYVNYCTNCGKPPRTRFDLDDQLYVDKGVLIRTLVYYLFLISLIILQHRNMISGVTMGEYIAFMVFFVSFTIIFGVIYGERWFNDAFRIPVLKPKAIIGVVAVIILSPLFVNLYFYLLKLWNQNIVLPNIYDTFDDTTNPLLYATLLTAVCPAVFEEIVFRGFLFTDFLKSFNAKTTIFLTSILFTFAHFEIYSSFWIFPFALILGYLRMRYRTIWLGVIIHFCHNFSMLLYSYYS